MNKFVKFEFDECLWPRCFDNNAVRFLGGRNDGGYPVLEVDLPKLSGFVSLGISTDWAFEDEICRLTGIKGVGFDAQTSKTLLLKHFSGAIIRFKIFQALIYAKRFFELPILLSSRFGNWFLIKKNVGFHSECDDWITFEEALEKCSTLTGNLLKIDIEGGEYRIMNSVIEKADSFQVILFEFHDADLNIGVIRKSIEKLRSKGFSPYFLRPNNCAPFRSDGLPVVFEIGLSRSPSQGIRETYQLERDAMNSPDRFPCFVQLRK